MTMTTAFMLFEGPTFTMETPTNWVVSSSPQFQAIFLGPTDQPIRPNMIVSLHPINADVTPEDVAANALQTQSAEYAEYEVLQEINFREFDGQGVMRRYRWVNPNENIPVVQMQAFLINQGILHTLTATRADNMPPEVCQSIDELFDYMLQSFRFRM